VIVSFKLVPLIIGELVLPDLIVQIVKDKAVTDLKLTKRYTTLAL
jgi:hypothetical protein